jgi:hypothetical protein
MEYLGLLVELAFLAMGIYLYLFAIGKAKAADPAARERAEAFRQRNAWWLRLASLALVAIMTVNIVLHLMQLRGQS